jgi:uncharacterized membrane protein
MYNGSRGSVPIAPGRQTPGRPDHGARLDGEKASVVPAVVALILSIIVNLIVFANVHLPVIRPALGFWFILVLPAYLIFTTAVWRGCALSERIGYSVVAVLLVLMLTGLTINEVLPLVGIEHPLDTAPILIVSDAINIALFVVRSRYPDRAAVRIVFAEFGREEVRLLAAALITVVLAVLGATRLNNGASGHVALIALAFAALVGIFSIRWLRFTREPVMMAVIYLVSLALLFTTSLRGWYITGHDIQQEYQVFQLTEAHGHWSMSLDSSAYYACLSITILPTELSRILNVDNPYVFKLFFQAIFAVCPILAYGIARRYFNRGISTLAVAYFVGFPTFFTDMPFLNRQEIGLLFVACGVLAATNPAWSWRRRQVSLVIAGLGVELSHYSTMYMLVGTLGIAWLCFYAIRLFFGSPSDSDSRTGQLSRRDRRSAAKLKNTVTIGVLGAFLAIIFAWGTLATNTTGQVLNDGSGAISSGAISLNLFSGSTATPDEVIQQLRQDSLQSRTSQEAMYLPVSAVSKAATPAVGQALNPLTRIGQIASSVGIPVVALNTLVRNFVAYGEQLFLAIGLVRIVISRRRGRHLVGRQFFCLCVGSIGMIAANTVLPSISADYGTLRAFQQGLLFFAPIIVVGSMTIFESIGARRARIASCIVCLGIYLGTSTVVPQLVGGNLAELNLNNNGTYYDLYYTTPQDSSAVAWLGAEPNVLAYPIQSTYSQGRFLFTSQNLVNGKQVISDAYPTLALRDSWLIMAPTVAGKTYAYTFTPPTGDLAEYEYPTGILNEYKNLVYTNGSTEIYK